MNQKQTHIVDIIFILALFGLFALSSLFLITAGAEIYHNTVNNMQANYELRTSTSYLSEKIRQSECSDLVQLKGVDAIALYETVGQTDYVTYLYYYDGYLRELYVSSGTDLGDSMLMAGQKISELDSIRFWKSSPQMISADIVYKDKSTASLLLNIKH